MSEEETNSQHGRGNEEDKVNINIQNERQKDWWDKISIVLQPVGGLIAAIAIAMVGWLGSQSLERMQQDDLNLRLYTELMSRREGAENTLRTDMFDKIFASFLSSKNHSNSEHYFINRKEVNDLTGSSFDIKKLDHNYDNYKISTSINDKEYHSTAEDIENKMLSLELIAMNFHESLDMKPLFLNILFKIIRLGKIENRIKNMREKHNNTKEKQQDGVEEERILSKIYRNRLFRLAQDITTRQRGVLEEFGESVTVVLNPKNFKGSICSDLKPFQKDEICTKDGYPIKEINVLSFEKFDKDSNDKDQKRYFHVSLKQTYTKWNMIKLEISSNGQSKKNRFKKELWVGAFDFPMTDNVYLSSRERYTFIVDEINKEKISITFIYFPSSYSGLKEKAFYHQRGIKYLEEKSNILQDNQKQKGILKRLSEVIGNL